jgi:hypothetical protein
MCKLVKICKQLVMSNLSKFLVIEHLHLSPPFTRTYQATKFRDIPSNEFSCNDLCLCREESFIFLSHVIGSQPIITIEN